MPDKYGNYKYSYLFLSNSKWNNGVLANTGMHGNTISIDKKIVTYLNYGIAGSNTQTQLSIYFKIHKSKIKTNSQISWSCNQTYLN